MQDNIIIFYTRMQGSFQRIMSQKTQKPTNSSHWLKMIKFDPQEVSKKALRVEEGAREEGREGKEKRTKEKECNRLKHTTDCISKDL